MRLFSVLLISLALLPLSTSIKCYTKYGDDETQIERTCGFDGYCKTNYYYDINGLRFNKICSREQDCPLKDGCMTYKKNKTIVGGEKADLTQCCCKGDLCNKDDHLADNPTSARYPPTVFSTKCYAKGWEDKTQIERTCGFDGYCKTNYYYDTAGLRFYKSCTFLNDCPTKDEKPIATGCKTHKNERRNSIGERIDFTECCCKGNLCNKEYNTTSTPVNDRSPPTKCYKKRWDDTTQIEVTCEYGYDYCQTHYNYDKDELRTFKRCTALRNCPAKDRCVTYKNHRTGKEIDTMACCCKGDLCNKEIPAANPTSDRYLPTL